MASALETRIRKLERRAAVVAEAAEAAKANANKPPFDWARYIQLFQEMMEADPEHWQEQWWKEFGEYYAQEIRAADNKN
jgi:hypothetical protein